MAPQVGFELATNSIQFYVIANLDKTYLLHFQDNCLHVYPLGSWLVTGSWWLVCRLVDWDVQMKT